MRPARPFRSASRARGAGRALAPGILTLTLLAAGAADARTVDVRWKQPAGTSKVAGFRIYTRHVDQGYGSGIDVGHPAPENGIYRYRLDVSDTDATYVVIRAYDAEGTEGPPSNERLILLPGPGAAPD